MRSIRQQRLVQARQPPVISCLDWAVDHVSAYAAPVLVHEISYRARQFVISGVFYRYREHGVFVKTSDDPASFRSWSRLRWSSALHGSFVLIQIPFPRKPAMANIAGERFWSAPARVSLQVIASGECPAACRTFMTANVAVQMLAQI